jgi:Domain of unknown function (DUF5658)
MQGGRPFAGSRMERLCKPWETSPSLFGDFAVLSFLMVQALDGVLTYIGIAWWGPGIEANPIVSSAVAYAGVGPGLTATKLVAAGCGIILYVRRVHALVAFLTAVYIAVAILPWAVVFLFVNR